MLAFTEHEAQSWGRGGGEGSKLSFFYIYTFPPASALVLFVFIDGKRKS